MADLLVVVHILEILIHDIQHNLLVLSREWMGVDGNGGMGLLLLVIMDHSLIPC